MCHGRVRDLREKDSLRGVSVARGGRCWECRRRDSATASKIAEKTTPGDSCPLHHRCYHDEYEYDPCVLSCIVLFRVVINPYIYACVTLAAAVHVLLERVPDPLESESIGCKLMVHHVHVLASLQYS